ncbi:uncharacterized protein LOC143855936 [Tasmannia lanceolata]|uniref:uncharacterized protein LOC143855936 n=1 Tax=Tasmannia lanceolata TaxID=3420 RepID=UPI004063A798
MNIDEKDEHSNNSATIFNPPSFNLWMLYVDGAARKKGSGAGLVLVGPDSFLLEYAIRLEFKVSNNEAEYDALLSRLVLALEVNADYLKVHSDSQLIAEQANGAYEAKECRMLKYLEVVREKLKRFRMVEIVRIPRTMNARADALSKMAASGVTDVGTVYVEILKQPRIEQGEIVELEFESSWMDPILGYLKDGIVLEDRKEARRLEAKAVVRADSKATEKFVYHDIICRFGIPRILVIDNGTQFSSQYLEDFR